MIVSTNMETEEITAPIIAPDSVYVFIDASNIWEAQKVKAKVFDYVKLKEYLKDKFSAGEMEIFYYTAYPAKTTRDYDLQGKHKFYTYLKKGLGFHVVKKELKRILVHENGKDMYKEKGNLDVEMTIDVIDNVRKYDVAILFTGDSDFLPLITYIKNMAKDVYVYSSENNISQELRTGSDGYYDVLKIEEDIWGSDLKHKDQSLELK